MGGGGGGGAPPAAAATMGGAGGGGGGLGEGLSHAQSQLLEVIRVRSESITGVSYAEIVAAMRHTGIAEGALRGALEVLSAEGHIFSTSDDDHYKVCDV